MNKSKFIQIIESKYLFYAVLCINLAVLCSSTFYPSMDGPAHLYNANLLYHFILGNDALGEFYSINTLPIPNWTSHFILTFFLFVFPAWLAEKAFLMLYVAGLALSFRYLIKIINPGNISLSILIFPFIYTFLFRLGFYNFSFSFILFFFTTGYWIKFHTALKPKHYLILGLLLLANYFTNVLMFGFLGITIGIHILLHSYSEYINSKKSISALNAGGKKLLGLFLISVPGLFFLLLFQQSVTFPSSDNSLPTVELMSWLNDVRPLIAFDYVNEAIYSEQILHILIILFVLPFIVKSQTDQTKPLHFDASHIFILPLVASIVLYFIIPNGASAGMMTDRYCLVLFMLAMTWIVARSVPNKGVNAFVICGLVFIHLSLLYKHTGTIRSMDKSAVSIRQLDVHIAENSTILPVNLSDNWLEPHFSNYLGTTKPLVILENYEASVGWFPIKWHTENMPCLLLDDQKNLPDFNWINNYSAAKTKQIDYVFFYGNLSKLEDPKWDTLKTVLEKGYALAHKSEDNYTLLYKRK